MEGMVNQENGVQGAAAILSKFQDQHESQTDLFKSSFKKFKSCKNPAKDFKKDNRNDGTTEIDDDASQILLDPTIGEASEGVVEWDKVLQERLIPLNVEYAGIISQKAEQLGLRHHSTWKVFECLVLVRNPFTPLGQKYWIQRSLIDFHKSPHITNIDNLESKEGKSIKDKLGREEFFKKLRWATFGYHHEWNLKVYTEESKCKFPEDLACLTKLIADILGFEDFKAEAAIANYYHLDSTLSGHVDRSEAYQDAPLFSISFGQAAVFLIGSRLKSVKPQAILLRSGDVAIMSGESRLSYHGVPRIFQSEEQPWNQESGIVSQNSTNKKAKLEHIETDDCFPNVDWNEFLSNYIYKSRINLNIRQVLFPNHSTLLESQAYTKQFSIENK